MLRELFAKRRMKSSLKCKGLENINIGSLVKSPDAFLGRKSFTAEFTATDKRMTEGVHGIINFEPSTGASYIGSNAPGRSAHRFG